MKTYRILAGVNFTACSMNAVVYAFEMVKPYACQLNLVFCYSEVISLTDLDDEMTYDELHSREGDRPQIEAHYRKKMDVFVDDLKTRLGKNKLADNSIETVLIAASPVDGLLKVSRIWSPDFMVIGTSLHHDTFEELMGTITADLVRKTEIPVLMVPEKGICQRPLKDVMFLTGFKQCDFESLHRLIDVLPSGAACIHCVHFSHEKGDEWDQKRLEALQLYCKETYRNQLIICENIVSDKLIQSIEGCVKQNDIQLIAMTRQRRHFISQILHPEIAQKLLFHTDIPFFIFCEY